MINGAPLAPPFHFEPTLGAISNTNSSHLQPVAPYDPLNVEPQTLGGLLSGVHLSGPPSNIPMIGPTSSSIMDGLEIPPGIAVRRGSFDRAVAETAQSLEGGLTEITRMELSRSYLARRDDQSSASSTHVATDDSEWEGGPDPDRPGSAQSSLSTYSLRELMSELGSRLGRPWTTFGQALLDRFRGGHRLGRSGSGRSDPGRGRARRRQL